MATGRLSVGQIKGTPRGSASHQRFAKSVQAQMAKVTENLNKVIRSIEATSPLALRYAVKPIYDESQNLVPVDTGKLKASGFIEVRKNTRGVTAVIGYARGNNPHYAAFVHERLDLYHEPPTQAKFLEEAANRHMGKIPARYADYVKRHVGL